MDNLENECCGTANPAEAEREQVAADLGKFKDVKALLNAYNSLEAEFTRRSQRLKELEGKSKAQPTADAANGEPSSELRKVSLYEAVINDEKVKEAVIADYLKSVASGRGVPILTGGISVPSPKTKPATVKEAGRLAKQFLKNS